MAHIQGPFSRKNGDTFYEVRYRDPDGRHRTERHARHHDAKLRKTELENGLATGNWIDPRRSAVTLATWVVEWRASVVDLRPSTLARLDVTVRQQVLPAFGARRLAAISNADVRAWVAELSTRRSPSTVRKAAFALRRILAAAVADRRLSFNPAEAVPLPGEHIGDQRFLDQAQIASLADSIEPRYRALVLVAAYGGLRFGELAALRRKRVDLLRGRVAVAETLVDVGGRLTFGPPKTKAGSRKVPLPRRVAAELATHLDRYTDPVAGALVFTGAAGAPLRRTNFRRRVWEPAVLAADLAPLTVHELRHTFVSLWVAAGANAKEVSVRAGHSSVAFTLDKYGHLYGDRDDDLADQLDALLEASAPGTSAEVVSLR